ncbi:GNAT family N-acetyltransferase [Proteinivorax tanatarense]|uniref:GNAT family N-acetyltransferase n=1 Tax=Proteinivorax tanatarense TaxID=1260629 RepID=A0AAU7VIK1_9FIRM
MVIIHNNQIVGIAPFVEKQNKKGLLKWTSLEFMGMGDYRNVIINRQEGNEQSIIKKIFTVISNMQNKWDLINLTHIKHDSTLANYLLKTQYNKHFKYMKECPQIKLSQHKKFEEFQRKYPVAKRTRKRLNKLQRETQYNFKVEKGITEATLDEFMALYTKENNHLVKDKNRRNRKNIYANKFMVEFLRNILKNNEKVRAFTIRDSTGKLLSYKLAYQYNNILHSWNGAYDPNYLKYSIGKITYYEMLSHFFTDSGKEVATLDLGAGRYPWKFEWTSYFIFNYKLQVPLNKKGTIVQKLYQIHHCIN